MTPNINIVDQKCRETKKVEKHWTMMSKDLNIYDFSFKEKSLSLPRYSVLTRGFSVKFKVWFCRYLDPMYVVIPSKNLAWHHSIQGIDPESQSIVSNRHLSVILWNCRYVAKFPFKWRNPFWVSGWRHKLSILWFVVLYILYLDW